MPNDVIPEPQVNNVLHVLVTREPFMDYFTITLDNGYTEELDVEDCRRWFSERGANMDSVDKALDHCWNFQRAEININNPKEPPSPKIPFAPNL
jgi:hypothetical protein